MTKITVVGLGPAGPELISTEVMELLEGNIPVYLRTAQHPAASAVRNAQSFDGIYEQSSAFEEVYATIVEHLVLAASESGDVVYAVPGSPLVAESTVRLLLSDPRVEIEIRAGLSFLDLCWNRLGVDPLESGVRIVDAHRFSRQAAGQLGPLLVAQCDSRWTMSDVKLAFEDSTPATATILHHLGLPDESIEELEWSEIDRAFESDHLTSLWIPEVASPVGAALVHVDEVARHLRVHCPWDKKQTHESLARHAVEESYELVEAITERQDEGDEAIIEELGDVLFQVFAHSAIAAAEGRFDVSDVANAVTNKLIERHPHVYGDVIAETPEDVVATWESNKLIAKGRKSLVEGIPRNLPALGLAGKLLRTVTAAGVEIDIGEVKDMGPGAGLLGLVDDCRRAGLDPDIELRNVVGVLRRRFEQAEQNAAGDGVDLAKASKEVVRMYWREAIGRT